MHPQTGNLRSDESESSYASWRAGEKCARIGNQVFARAGVIRAGGVLELDLRYGAGRILGHDMEVKWSIVEVRD